MTLDQAIQRTYLLATGKTTTLSSGSTKYEKIKALLNLYKDVWADESGIQWKSLRAVATIGTVTATDTFVLTGVEVDKISNQEEDYVRINHVDGVSQSLYTITPIEKLYRGGQSVNPIGGGLGSAQGLCAVAGTSLIFNYPFTASSVQIGGSIKVPHYPTPADMSGGTDVVAVDDPNWICFMAAAEYVRNDITRQNQYGNLIAQATNSMIAMKERNMAQEDSVDDSWSPLGVTW